MYNFERERERERERKRERERERERYYAFLLTQYIIYKIQFKSSRWSLVNKLKTENTE